MIKVSWQPPDAEDSKDQRSGRLKPMEETMFGSNGFQLLQRAARECRGRSVQRSPLRSEYFPVEVRGREIVTQQGVVIAAATDPSISEEIARRLNESYWSDQEDQWAL
jgi:hypothetical protein